MYIHHDELLKATPGHLPVTLQWRRTREDEFSADDFIAIDAGAQVARAYYMSGHENLGLAWRCFLYFPAGHDTLYAQSMREALLVVEDAYNAWRADRERWAAMQECGAN